VPKAKESGQGKKRKDPRRRGKKKNTGIDIFLFQGTKKESKEKMG